MFRPHDVPVGVILDDRLALDVGIGEVEAFREAAQRARSDELLARAPLFPPLAVGGRAPRLVEYPALGSLMINISSIIIILMFINIIKTFFII